MAYDEKKMDIMRGDAEPDPVDPNEAAEGENEPSEEELAAAGRAMAALKQGDRRAFCAAIKDLT